MRVGMSVQLDVDIFISSGGSDPAPDTHHDREQEALWSSAPGPGTRQK